MSGQAAARSPLRGWFDLARAGNFPSVASNVVAALVLSHADAPNWPAAAMVGIGLIAGCLAYAGGATFNDVADAEFDARHRPERAIPRGLVSRGRAALVGAVELAAGLVLLVGLGASWAWAAALAATILAYDWLHKRWSGSVVLMAACRVLLAMTIASLPGHALRPAFLAWVGALFVYIVGLSVLARREYAPGAPAASIGRNVGRLLALMPLIDAAALLAIGAWGPAAICAAAFPLGRLAQRWAAST